MRTCSWSECPITPPGATLTLKRSGARALFAMRAVRPTYCQFPGATAVRRGPLNRGRPRSTPYAATGGARRICTLRTCTTRSGRACHCDRTSRNRVEQNRPCALAHKQASLACCPRWRYRCRVVPPGVDLGGGGGGGLRASFPPVVVVVEVVTATARQLGVVWRAASRTQSPTTWASRRKDPTG
eukprot:4578404-Prymnesium_polylepis.3